MQLDLGPQTAFKQARYVITLALDPDTDKRLVLFRLPSLDRTRPKANDSADGWCYYAMEAECPHAGGPMARARVDVQPPVDDIEDAAYVTSCPWHGYDFNVETGESDFGYTACTYAIDARGPMLRIDVPDDVQLRAIDPVSEEVKLKRQRPPTEAEAAAERGEGGGEDDEVDEQTATVCSWAARILNTANPERKVEQTTRLYRVFVEREATANPLPLGRGTAAPPARPAREANLTVVRPGAMPGRGKGGSVRSRIHMLHALANIELWAIDLALDIFVRFATFRTTAAGGADEPGEQFPRAFFHDFLKVAADEAKHFTLLRTRLEAMGTPFGSLPVHEGLWESATTTAHDVRARISVVCLVHEARGLDVNPSTITKFARAAEASTTAAEAAEATAATETLTTIHHDEITHVTTGHRWLVWICEHERADPVAVFRASVAEHFHGGVRGPFNDEARAVAGLDRRYYADLVGDRRRA